MNVRNRIYAIVRAIRTYNGNVDDKKRFPNVQLAAVDGMKNKNLNRFYSYSDYCTVGVRRGAVWIRRVVKEICRF